MLNKNNEEYIKTLRQLALQVFKLTVLADNKQDTALLSELLGPLKELLDKYEDDLHPDLSLDLMSFVDLKDDSFDDPSIVEGVRQYKESTAQILRDIGCVDELL